MSMPESFAGTEGFELSRHERKKIEMRFAHLKRILKLGRLRLRGPRRHRPEPEAVCIAGRATTNRSDSVHRVASKLRKMRQGQRFRARLSTKGPTARSVAADFCNKIGPSRTSAANFAVMQDTALNSATW
jgi:hypothetical protein